MELDDAAVMAAFEKRKTAHWIAVGLSAVFLVAWLFVVEAVAGRLPAIGHSPLYFSATMLAGDLPWLVAMLVFVRKNWRCPACDRALPLSGVSGGLRMFRPGARCPHCGRQLAN